MENMEAKILIFSMGFACLLCCAVRSERISRENAIWDEDIEEKRSDDVTLEPGFYNNLSTGPEGLSIDVLDMNENTDGEREKEKLSGSEVDEETIRKAEKMADKDLLNGLNRILKNNETLKDIFRAEKVYEIP